PSFDPETKYCPVPCPAKDPLASVNCPVPPAKLPCSVKLNVRSGCRQNVPPPAASAKKSWSAVSSAVSTTRACSSSNSVVPVGQVTGAGNGLRNSNSSWKRNRPILQVTSPWCTLADRRSPLVSRWVSTPLTKVAAKVQLRCLVLVVPSSPRTVPASISTRAMPMLKERFSIDPPFGVGECRPGGHHTHEGRFLNLAPLLRPKRENQDAPQRMRIWRFCGTEAKVYAIMFQGQTIKKPMLGKIGLLKALSS